jgi:RES domain
LPRPIHLPPGNVAGGRLVGSTLSTDWIRVHSIHYPPIHYGKNADNRFTPKNSPFGVLYVGENLQTALFELFGDEMITDDRRVRTYRWMSYQASSLQLPPVSVCDLCDLRTRAALGVDIASLMTADLQVPQAWALAIMNHSANVDGIQYQSRFTEDNCLALFDRRNITILTTPLSSLSDLPEANDFLDKFEISLV